MAQSSDSLKPFESQLIAYVGLTVVVFLFPLVFFGSILNRTRRQGILSYGVFVSGFNRSFESKWIDPSGQVDASKALGAPEIQCLADINTSFDRVLHMRPFLARGADTCNCGRCGDFAIASVIII